MNYIFHKYEHQYHYSNHSNNYSNPTYNAVTGHLDEGESELDAALRETAEEAGLSRHQHSPVDGFRICNSYKVGKQRKNKESVFFLSKLIDPQQSITLSSEHVEFRWCSLEESCELITFASLRNIYNEAHKFIIKINEN